MKPRILIVENSIDVTGALNSILGSSSYLKDNFDFVFILPSGSKGKKLVEKKRFKVYELPLKEIRKNIFSILFYFPFLLFNVLKLKRIITKEGIDLIVSNDFYNLLPPLSSFLGTRIPYVCFVRFMPSRFPNVLVRLWLKVHLKFSNKIVAVSVAVKKELPPNDKIMFMYEGIDCSTAIDLNRESKTILYLANYIQGKGQEYAIRSFAAIYKSFPDWKLRFVGSDMGLKKNSEFKGKLQLMSKKLGCNEQVEFVGFSENILKEFRNAAMVLNFSDSESFSFTCLEAMQAGLPVIATKCGGPEEIITTGIDGELVEVKNQEQMSDVLKKLLSDSAQRKRYGEQACKSVYEKFNLTNTATRLMSIYLEALKTN